jgi:methionyl-tRNA synthetase
VRYFLLRDGGIVNDGDFSHETLISKLNNDLADTLGQQPQTCHTCSLLVLTLLPSAPNLTGNLFARLTAPSLNPTCLVPACGALTSQDEAFVERMKRLPGTSAFICRLSSSSDTTHSHSYAHLCEDRVAEHYTNVEFGPGISAIFDVLYDANKYLQDNEPWKLRKTDPQRCETVIYVALEAARLSALLLQPIVPRSATKMLDMLGVPADERSAQALVYGRRPGDKLVKEILFTKVK